MKLTHKLGSAVLLAAVGVAVAVPGVTKADDTTFTGDMDIQFTRNTEEITNTERPSFGSEDTDPNQSGSESRTIRPVEFGIQDVTPLSFGERAIVTDGNVREFWAKNYTETDTNGDVTYVAANNVLIKDARQVLDHSYTLTAQITKPLTTTVTEGGGPGVERTLAGATLDYTNMNIKTPVTGAIALPDDALPASKAATVSEGAPALIVNNTDVDANGHNDKGQGQSYIYFGYLNASGTQNSEESVKLTVGAEQTIFQGDYRGEITWVMTAGH